MFRTRAHITLLSTCLLISACQGPTTPPTPAGATTPEVGTGAGIGSRIGGKLRGADQDGDGVSDLIERALGSDPALHEADADHDRIPDRIEAILGTRPDKADSDGDGFSDLFERFESHHALRDKLKGIIKDRLADRRGYGLLATTVVDYDSDGTSAAVDADDDNNGIPDADEDADLDGVANGIERTGYYAEKGTGVFKAWTGNMTQTYYKTDPMQWSTDADPYGDGMEASGKNMDSAVPFPGNHPLIPALPDLKAELTSYTVSPYATISNSANETQSESWTQSTVNETVSTTEVKKSINAKASYSSTGGVKASVDAHASKDDTTVNTSRVTTDASKLSTSGWSNATTTDTARAGKLTVTLKYSNIGTAPAYNVVPTINLYVDGQTFTFTADSISSLGSGLAQTVKTFTYPPLSSATTMTLSLDELGHLQSGAPILSEVADMTASVFTSIGGTLTDADQVAQRSAYLGSNDWATYQQGVMQKSFLLYCDTGDGKANKLRMFAPPEFNPGTASDPPDVTVADALAWAYQASEQADGSLNLKIWDPTTGKYASANTANWDYFFDEGTGESITADTDIMDLTLYAGARMMTKAPPDASRATALRVFDYDRTAHTLSTSVFDYYKAASVAVKSVANGTTGINLTAVENTANTGWTATGATYLDLRPTGTEVLAVTNDLGVVENLTLPAVTTGATTKASRPSLDTFTKTASKTLGVGTGQFKVIWTDYSSATPWTLKASSNNGATWYKYEAGQASTTDAEAKFAALDYASAAKTGSQIVKTDQVQSLGDGGDKDYLIYLVHQGRYLAKVLVTRKTISSAVWDMGF